MIGVVAVIRVKEGREAEFEQGFLEMTAEVKANEPANRMYQLTRSRAPTRCWRSTTTRPRWRRTRRARTTRPAG